MFSEKFVSPTKLYISKKVISWVLMYFSSSVGAVPYLVTYTERTSDESRERSWHYKKLNCLTCAVLICSCGCLPFQDKWTNVQTVEGEKWKFMKLLLQLLPVGMKPVLLLNVSHIQKTTFMWMQDCYKKRYTYGLQCIWAKWSLYVTSWSKRKVEDLKPDNVMPAKDGFLILERGLALKCQDKGKQLQTTRQQMGS